MEIEINKDENITTLKPQKLYPKGHDLEISFCKDYVCFTIEDRGIGTNVQISYEEWEKIRNIKVNEG
jgi:hypothetical protein